MGGTRRGSDQAFHLPGRLVLVDPLRRRSDEHRLRPAPEDGARTRELAGGALPRHDRPLRQGARGPAPRPAGHPGAERGELLLSDDGSGGRPLPLRGGRGGLRGAHLFLPRLRGPANRRDGPPGDPWRPPRPPPPGATGPPPPPSPATPAPAPPALPPP